MNERESLLTPRQKEVLDTLALGLPGKEAAARLGISTSTLKIHKEAIAKVLELPGGVPDLTSYLLARQRRLGHLDGLAYLEEYQHLWAIAGFKERFGL